MPRSTQFRIRIVAGASIFFVDGFTLDILDVTNNLLCVYDYRGVSLSAGTPITAHFRGPWNDFTTPVAVEVRQFGGLARIGSVGGLDRTVNSLEIRPLAGAPVAIVPFSTGLSVGFGASMGMGILSMMFPPVPASRAPWPHSV